MADSKISALAALTAATDDDLLLIVDSTDPATVTGMDKKITVADFQAPVYQAISDAIVTAETYTDLPLTRNTVSGTAYTFALSDAGNVMVETTSGTAQTLTIPTNGSVAFPVGSMIEVTRTGAGLTTIDGTAVTLQGSITTLDQYGNLALYKKATDTWVTLGGVSGGDTAGAASSTSGDIVQFSGITGKVLQDTGKSIDTDTTMAADSASRVPTQHAAKTYADTVSATAVTTAKIPAGVQSMMVPVWGNTMAIGAMTTMSANTLRGVRTVVPKTGTMNKAYWYLGTVNAGNYYFAVYDVGEASTGNYTRLWNSGVQTPAVGTTHWENAGNPGISVVRGQHVFLALIVSDATMSIGSIAGTVPSGSAPFAPNGMMTPDGGDDTQYVNWFYNVGSFTTPPTTITQGSVTTTTFNGVLVGAVT